MLDVLDFIAERGGDPAKIRESQRLRFQDEGVVDEVMKLYEDARASMYASHLSREKDGWMSWLSLLWSLRVSGGACHWIFFLEGYVVRLWE